MKAKWYIGALLIILALVGVSLEQVAIPNQEIVVQFADEDVSSREARETIAIVRKQLQAIGVDYIKIQETLGGRLKITYYSDVDVISVQKLFSQDQKLTLGYSSSIQNSGNNEFPFQKKSNSYNLDVYEIQKKSDDEAGFNGYVIEFELKSNRFFTPNVYFFKSQLDTEERNNFEKVAYEFHKNVALAIETDEHSIPEVRAGPGSIGNA